MSKTIAKLLGMPERDLANLITRLEHMCANAGVDTRLTADIITGLRQKVRLLGLDPSDTTAEELFHALKKRARAHDDLFKSVLKITNDSTAEDVTKKVADKANVFYKNDVIWLPKTSAMKKVLIAVVPKKTIKLLGYRSITSYLKREDPFELYAVARHVEDSSWLNQVEARIKRLMPKDFEEQKLRVAIISAKHSTKLRNSKVAFKSLLLPCDEMGTVLIFPDVPKDHPGGVLLAFLLVLLALQRMSLRASYQHVFLADNGLDHMPELLEIRTPDYVASVGGLAVSWQSLHKLLSSGYGSRLETDFLVADFQWRDIETMLATIVPETDMWVGSHILGVEREGRITSLHILDVLANLVKEVGYAHSGHGYMSSALWHELQFRYVGEDSIRKHIASHLEINSIIRGMIG